MPPHPVLQPDIPPPPPPAPHSPQPEASTALAGFDYPPVGAVTLAYPVSAVRDDRKDAQVPVSPPCPALCCTALHRAVLCFAVRCAAAAAGRAGD